MSETSLPQTDPSVREQEPAMGLQDELKDAEHHHTLYFEDGDIILFAKSTDRLKKSTSWLLRVHKAFLSHHSPVFADMFSIPQPAAQDTVEGCPLVALQDSEVGLHVLLSFFDGNVSAITSIGSIITVDQSDSRH